MNGIESMSTQLQTTEKPQPSPEKAQAIAQKAMEVIVAQSEKQVTITRNALESCRKIGEAASKAKEALGHGPFTDWVNEYFDSDKPKSGLKLSVQWIRMCMRVHEVFVRLENHKDRDAIIDKYSRDVKSFARVLTILGNGGNPLTYVAEARAAKLDTSGGSDAAPEASAKALQRKLDAANDKIAKLEAKLAEANEKIKVQALEISTLKADLKAAAKGAKGAKDVTDAVIKPARTHGANTPDEARDMIKKAEAKRAAKGKPAAKTAKPAAKRAAKPAVDLPEVEVGDVPADLLANAQATNGAGMGASA